ncbi:MAG: biotin--[acetyl-CoA-carboxylase] ligase [Cyclobacteriaceae bacterium]|nr:biotin--[acetyl-CoA-carboxylase] ligase [Cyclobacteriaceae bacterium]
MGKNIVFVPECHSTNTLAVELTQKRDLAEGTVVITNNQTKGRGQQSNIWVTESGKNLTFSVLLKPTFLHVKDQFLLNMVISLGVSDFLAELKKSIQVKWPNDVMIANRKICGILIESQIQGSAFNRTVAGIGLNVNQKGFSSPRATSMAIETNTTFDLQSCLDGLCGTLEQWYLTLRQRDYQRIKGAYLDRLYGAFEKRTFVQKGEAFEGIIEGVDDSGRLMISTQDGLKYYNTKEVSFDYEPLT